MNPLHDKLVSHPFFKDFEDEYLQFISDCASLESFAKDAYLLYEKHETSHFYLILSGKVGLRTFVEQQGFKNIQEIKAGDMVGWSWLVPPHHWHFDAIALEPSEAIAIDAVRMRERCEADHSFGYTVLKRLSLVLGERLRVTRELMK